MSRQRLVKFALAIFFPLFVWAQPSSQTLRDRDPDLDAAKRLATELQQANFHSGPFYLWSRVRIADAGYSEQSYLPTGDTGGGLALSIEAPQRLYLVPRKKVVFTADLVPGYSFFESNDERRNQFNYLARGDVHFLFNHLYLDLYAQREDQLRAQVADVNRLATLRSDEAGVAGEVKYSSRTSGTFSLRFRDMSYPESRFQPDIGPGQLDPVTGDPLKVPVFLLNRNERNARLSLMHKTFPLTSLFVAGERSDYDFERATYKNSTRTWVGGGFLYNAGRTRLRGEAGPARLEFDDPTQRDYEGLVAALEASRSNGRWQYGLGVQRDIGFSIFLNNNYFVSNLARVNAEYAATRKLSLRGGSTYERDTYDVEVGGRRRRDDISYTYAGFSYAIRRVRAGLDVGWYERDSTFLEDDEDAGIRYVVHLSFIP